MSEPVYTKIAFELEEDEDGYPPLAVETLWAWSVEDGYYCLDSIPFFAHEVSPGDVVETKEEFGQSVFKRVVRPSANSVVRIYVTDESDTQTARIAFKGLGCESELSNLPKLFALEIPESSDFEAISSLLEEGVTNGRWEYEEACMRHTRRLKDEL